MLLINALKNSFKLFIDHNRAVLNNVNLLKYKHKSKDEILKEFL